jgi:uncharacterized protein YcnI
MKRHVIACALLVLAGAALVVARAAAHVTVGPQTATKGGFTTLTFNVPNEQEKAVATNLEVAFPTDHPLAFVSVEPVPGWTVTPTKTKLATPITSDDGEVTEAVSSISWVGKIEPGQFQRFAVSVGPLPDDVDQITFPAIQTYDDGTVVRWVDTAVAGQPEPEHPAPVLKLVAAAAPTASTASTASTVSKSDVDQARTFGIVGIALGAAGLAAAVAAATRRRKTPS